MSIKHEWKIEGEQVDMRLDLFLTSMLPEQTRSALQKLIKSAHVLVNGEAGTVHRFLKDGDIVTYQEKEAVILSITPQKLDPKLEPTVIEETDEWVVLNKPAGLLVHPSSSSTEPTLIDWLMVRYPAMSHIGEDPVRPGIVHRLDREVSGLLVVAKTQKMFDHLKIAFSQRTVKKEYIAFAHGVINKDTDDIKLRIARSHKEPRMAARPVGEEEGKAAWTHFDVKERFIGATLVSVDILSGRTHQIRAHFHGIGHPIIGDHLYKIKTLDRHMSKNVPLMLQSVALAFSDLEGNLHEFSLPPLPMFADLASEFRRS